MIGVAVADESSTYPRLENRGSEYPPRGRRIAIGQDRAGMDPGATASRLLTKYPCLVNDSCSLKYRSGELQ